MRANEGTLNRSTLPDAITDDEHLEDLLSTPTAELVDEFKALDGDVIVLGVAGKMGVTLARMAKRAAPDKRIIGVARFSDPDERTKLDGWGIETIKADLLDDEQVATLPQVRNVIYMAGRKFGTGEDAALTWAMNTLAPANVGAHFRESRIVAFSTIHVYPWTNPVLGGVTEATPPMARPGEYSNSVVGRERAIEYATRTYGSSARNTRLVYSIDMRYGVLQEIATWVREGRPIPVATGHVNVIWQGDANAMMLRTLHHTTTPASPLNIGGPDTVSVRLLAQRFADIYGKRVEFVGEESECLLVNCDEAMDLFGYPKVPLKQMIRWVAEWVDSGKSSFGKPSKFEVRTGVF